MTTNTAYSRSHPRSLDFSRVREQTADAPANYLSYGTVGHYDATPAYARIDDGDVLVEVTLVPGGDEVVARLDFDAVDGGGSYFPLSYGQRVLVGFPNGENGDPVILGRCSDKSWPFPEAVAGVDTSTDNVVAPCFVFIKTQDGQLLAIETGDGADIVVHSGASVQLKSQASSAVLVTGRTHIGSTADWETGSEPAGATVSASGFVTPGTPGTVAAAVTLPNTNTTIPPPLNPFNPLLPLPADGVLRVKDRMQSNVTIDAEFWAWVIAMHATLAVIGAAWNTLALAGGGPLVVPPGAALPIPAVVIDPPATLTSQPASGSLNTCADG